MRIMASSFYKYLDHTKQRITLLLWTSDRLVAETYIRQHPNSQQKNIYAPVGFEPAISARERPQTHEFDHAATGTGGLIYIYIFIYTNFNGTKHHRMYFMFLIIIITTKRRILLNRNNCVVAFLL